MNGAKTKYYYYDSNKQSIMTIPVKIAKSLNWNHLDDIHSVIKTIDGQVGLFLFKKENQD